VQRVAVDREQLARQLVDVAYLEGDFLLASGRRSRYYFDKYRFETRPELLAPVASLIADLIPQGTARIAGPELGAVALATATSLASGLPCLFVRGEAKGYGTGNRIEGPFEPDDPVAVIEDVLTSGGSAIKAAAALVEAGCRITRVIGVIDRDEGAADAIAAAGFDFAPVFTRSELERFLSH